LCSIRSPFLLNLLPLPKLLFTSPPLSRFPHSFTLSLSHSLSHSLPLSLTLSLTPPLSHSLTPAISHLYFFHSSFHLKPARSNQICTSMISCSRFAHHFPKLTSTSLTSLHLSTTFPLSSPSLSPLSHSLTVALPIPTSSTLLFTSN
jgi:hypothetical protein